MELVSRIGQKKSKMRLDKLFWNSVMAGPLLGFGCAITLSTNASPWYQENAPGLISKSRLRGTGQHAASQRPPDREALTLVLSEQEVMLITHARDHCCLLLPDRPHLGCPDRR